MNAPLVLITAWSLPLAVGPGGPRNGPAEMHLNVGSATGYVCVAPGAEVVVTLRMEELPEPVSGYQAFVEFDETTLTFTLGEYALPDPFGWPVITPIVAVDGQLDLAAGIFPFTQTPTQQDADLATLRFMAAASGSPSRVEFGNTIPPTVLTLPTGSPLVPVLLDSPWIAIEVNPADPCGCFPADLDDSGAVDTADYVMLADCLTGPGGGPAVGPCVCADFDEDGDVDLGDYALLQIWWTP